MSKNFAIRFILWSCFVFSLVCFSCGRNSQSYRFIISFDKPIRDNFEISLLHGSITVWNSKRTKTFNASVSEFPDIYYLFFISDYDFDNPEDEFYEFTFSFASSGIRYESTSLTGSVWPYEYYDNEEKILIFYQKNSLDSSSVEVPVHFTFGNMLLY